MSENGFWIQVFRAGTWTDSAGVTRTWTEEDLDRIVENYDPKDYEAPLVIGHPKDDSPAYGWVEALKREGDVLLAKVKPTVERFVDWVRAGLYKKISIALNPGLKLRHIGFLGGAPPAVKGLEPVRFSDGDYTEVESEFAQQRVKLNQKGVANARALIRQGKVNTTSPWSFTAADENRLLGDPPDWGRYGEWFLAVDPDAAPDTKAHYKYPFGKVGVVYRSGLIAVRQRAGQQGAAEVFEAAGRLLEEIDKRQEMSAQTHVTEEIAMPEGRNGEELVRELEEMKRLNEELKSKLEEKEAAAAEFSEKMRKLESELEKEKKEKCEFSERIRALEQAVNEERSIRLRMKYERFCDELVAEGRLPAELKGDTVEILMMAHALGEYEFSDGKSAAVEKLEKWLRAQPARVPTGEFATKDKAADTRGGDLDRMIAEYMDKHNADYRTAVLELSREHPELFREVN